MLDTDLRPAPNPLLTFNQQELNYHQAFQRENLPAIISTRRYTLRQTSIGRADTAVCTFKFCLLFSIVPDPLN